MLTASALAGLPEVRRGDDLGAQIVAACETGLEDGDVLVIAHKVVSKAEGRLRALAEVRPSPRAQELARDQDRDPRHVQVVLDESRSVLRAAGGVLICVTHHGFVCANAGVDASNAGNGGGVGGGDVVGGGVGVGPGETVVLLPVDPDRSARGLRARLRQLSGVAPAIVITDSFGRAWRHGQCDVAIGCAGLLALEDWRGRPDAAGRPLRATWIAVADELAAAADLARTKDGSQPVVLVRGAGRHVTADDGPGAAALLRAEREDLFRR